MYCRDCRYWASFRTAAFYGLSGKCNIHGVYTVGGSPPCIKFGCAVPTAIRIMATVDRALNIVPGVNQLIQIHEAGYLADDKIWLDISPRGKDD